MVFKKFFVKLTIILISTLAILIVHAENKTENATAQKVPSKEFPKELRVGAVAGAILYFNKNITTKKWEGIIPAFAEDLSNKLMVKIKYIETTWDNSVPDLQSNKIDLMIGLIATPANQKIVNFSEPLFYNTYTVVCKKGYFIGTWQHLNDPNIKLSVDKGSSYDQLTTRILTTNPNISRLENFEAATMALQTGKVDCQVVDAILAQPILAKHPTLGQMSVPTPIETIPVCVGLRKEPNPILQKMVNNWIKELRNKDEVKKIILKNMEKLAKVKSSAFPSEIKF